MIRQAVEFVVFAWIMIISYLVTVQPVHDLIDALTDAFVGKSSGWFTWFGGMCKFTYGFIFVFALGLAFYWLFLSSQQREPVIYQRWG